MDRASFIQESIGHLDAEIRENESIVNRALRRAEDDCHTRIGAVPERGVLRTAMENRFERHVLDGMLAPKAELFDAGDAKLKQTFDHYRSLIEIRDAEWSNRILAELTQSRGGAGFAVDVIPPGFSYDTQGRPI